MKWVEIDLDINNLEAGVISSTQLKNKKIGVVKLNSWIYAFQTICPHAAGSMLNGWCEKESIVCPLHRHAFDLKTGRSTNGHGDYLTVYPTKIVDNKLYIGIKTGFLDRLFKDRFLF